MDLNWIATELLVIEEYEKKESDCDELKALK